MENLFHLSKLMRPPVLFECWQAGEVAPIDCSTFTGAVEETSLPWVPAVVAINAALGQFKLAAPSAPQAALLTEGRRYAATVVFRNGVGDPVLGVIELLLVAVK